MNERVFVTGSSGFIGSSLARKLCSQGYRVSCLMRKGSYHPILQGLSIDIVEGDITDRNSVQRGIAGCDYVFHAAALISFNRFDKGRLFSVNVEGTRNVLEAALSSRVKRVVHLSAAAVFGYSTDERTLIDENTYAEITEENVYAWSKKCAEDEVMRYHTRGLECVIANPVTVYGQGDKSLNSGFLIKAINSGALKVCPPGGTSAVSVDDVVDGLLLLMKKGKGGERYILANGNFRYVELCRIIADVLGVRQVRRTIPCIFRHPAVFSATIAEALLHLFHVRHPILSSHIIEETFGYKYFSAEKAERELGWKPEVTLEEALKKAVAFYRTEGLL